MFDHGITAHRIHRYTIRISNHELTKDHAIPIYYGPMGDAVKWRKLYQSCGQSQSVDRHVCDWSVLGFHNDTHFDSQHISEGPLRVLCRVTSTCT